MPFLPFKGILYDSMPYMHVQLKTSDGRRYPCADFELNTMECLEAYGAQKGMHMCQKYLEDLTECSRGLLSTTRTQVMYLEKLKQISEGKLKPSEIFSEPIPYDAYIAGTFWP